MYKTIFSLFILFTVSILLLACGGKDKNSSPIAIAEANFEEIQLGETARLDASKSSDKNLKDTINYQWGLSSKPETSLLPSNISEQISFDFIPDVDGSYQIELTVNDGQSVGKDSIIIMVYPNAKPDVVTDYDQSKSALVLGDSMTIDASLTTDPETKDMSFSWQVKKQPLNSDILNQAGDDFLFIPEHLGEYEVVLTVSDGWNEESKVFNFLVVRSSVALIPQLSSTLTAIDQVENVFGINSVDLPFTHDAEHLTVENDDVIGDHFVFILHLEEDGDRSDAVSDRQRSEMKTYNNSTENITCKENDRMKVLFSFKADYLNLSTSFTHFMQIKGQSDHPLFAITAKRTNSEEKLRLNFGSNDEIWGAVSWDLVNNRWLDVEVEFQCAVNGYLSAQILDSITHDKYIYVEIPSLKMWQDLDDDLFGIKVGIYRKVKSLIDDSEFKAGLDSLEDKVRVSGVVIQKL
jgi:hypothetical protein